MTAARFPQRAVVVSTPHADGNGVDTFGIYSAIKVGEFECNGAGSCTHVTLTRTNRSTTLCADGAYHASCDVRYLDFSALGLSSGKIDDVTSALQASAACAASTFTARTRCTRTPTG
jgi:hypothetical protein